MKEIGRKLMKLAKGWKRKIERRKRPNEKKSEEKKRCSW